MEFLMVTGGLIMLLFAGDLLVRGAVALANRLGIPPIVIGLTIVAMGTSAPELVTCLEAVLTGVPALAIGNIVGSNIANVLLVLGVPAILYPTLCNQPMIRRNTAIMIATTVLFMGLAWNGELGVLEGATMFSLLVVFLLYSAQRARAMGIEDTADELEELSDGLPKTWFRMGVFLAAGAIGLPLGAHLLVDGSVSIARGAGVSEGVIGLTLVAFGTSLPELATTVVAAIRKQADVALGNVIGSNLFNVLGILGITAMVQPVPVDGVFLAMDFWIMLAAALVIAPFALLHARIGRLTGMVFILAYGTYFLALVGGGGTIGAA